MDSTDLVLVTGGAGWLGSGLIDALLHGLPDCPDLTQAPPNRRVRALVLPGEEVAEVAAAGERLEVIHGDIRKPEDCARFCAGAKGAVLFHTAGIIHPRRVRDFYDINLTGSVNVLEAASSAGLRRAVVMSSNSPCGCNPHPDHLFDEESPYRPYMHYGRSKMQMELAVKKIHAAGKIETVIIRAPWFYGPRQPARQTLFFTMIRDGKMPLVGGGVGLRSMAYIDNLCQGLLRAAAHPGAAGQIYWIADARPYPMHEVVDTVEALLEKEFDIPCDHKRLRLPGLTSEIAWLIDRSLQGLGLYHQKFHVLSEMNKTIACTIHKARTELGYEPAIDLKEGMRRSLAWCKTKGLLPASG